MTELFVAHIIDVPEDVVDADGMVMLKMREASHVLVQRAGADPFMVSFWDGLLLTKMDGPVGWAVKLLLPLDATPGDYVFEGEFYYLDSEEHAFSAQGSFTVDASVKVDCGCVLFGQPASHASMETLAARRAICAACPSNEEDVCMECGCIIAMKITGGTNSCPIGKWGPEDA